MAKKGGKVEAVPEPEPVKFEPVKGTSTFVFPDASKYSGEFLTLEDGRKVRHGKGVHVVGPESYDGEWDSDKMHGQGIYKFSSGAVYEGKLRLCTSRTTRYR
jgi:hypothetical protein